MSQSANLDYVCTCICVNTYTVCMYVYIYIYIYIYARRWDLWCSEQFESAHVDSTNPSLKIDLELVFVVYVVVFYN